jgi:hypothetical protein
MQKLPASIGGTIVHQQEFPIFVRLPAQGIERRRQIGHHIEYGDDDGYFAHGLG